MEKLQLQIDPLTGADAEAIIAKMMNAPPEAVARAKAIYR
jgi:hypothetical protein